MRQITTTTHVLEIFGPRQQDWRPAGNVEQFLEAQRLAEGGSLFAALRMAEDTYVAVHGSMHGVAFRVRTASETLTGLGSAAQVLNGAETD